MLKTMNFTLKMMHLRGFSGGYKTHFAGKWDWRVLRKIDEFCIQIDEFSFKMWGW